MALLARLLISDVNQWCSWIKVGSSITLNKMEQSCWSHKSSFFFQPRPKGECGHIIFIPCTNRRLVLCSQKCIIKQTLQLYFYFRNQRSNCPKTFKRKREQRFCGVDRGKKEKAVTGPLRERGGCLCKEPFAALIIGKYYTLKFRSTSRFSF